MIKKLSFRLLILISLMIIFSGFVSAIYLGISEGIHACYDLDGDGNDYLGVYNGTIYGTVVENTTDYIIGSSMHFQGTEDYINLSDSSAFPALLTGQSALNFSITAWAADNRAIGTRYGEQET